MELPELISAEAAVRSNRAGYKSIFDPNANISADNVKQFYSDPKFIKEAIGILQQSGFSFEHFGTFSISISAPPEIYEKIFGIKLITQPASDESVMSIGVDGQQKGRFDYINTSKSKFNNLLSGVALSPRTRKQNISKCPKKEGEWYLCPHEIPEKLNGQGILDQGIDGNGVRIVVIDSGCFVDHPYLQEGFFKSEKNVSIDNRYLIGILDAKYAFHQKRKMQHRLEIWKYEKEIDGLSNAGVELSERDIQRIEDIRAEIRKLEIRIRDIDGFKEKIDRYKYLLDPTGHGTAVISNLLPVAPKAKIIVVKDFGEENDTDLAYFPISIRKAVSLKPHIISASYGFTEHYSTIIQNLPAYYQLIQAEVAHAVKKGIIVLFPSGNAEQDDPEFIDVQGQWNDVIVVGGAHRGWRSAL